MAIKKISQRVNVGASPIWVGHTLTAEEIGKLPVWTSVAEAGNSERNNIQLDYYASDASDNSSTIASCNVVFNAILGANEDYEQQISIASAYLPSTDELNGAVAWVKFPPVLDTYTNPTDTLKYVSDKTVSALTIWVRSAGVLGVGVGEWKELIKRTSDQFIIDGTDAFYGFYDYQEPNDKLGRMWRVTLPNTEHAAAYLRGKVGDPNAVAIECCTTWTDYNNVESNYYPATNFPTITLDVIVPELYLDTAFGHPLVILGNSITVKGTASDLPS